jgi:hypothetical protein
MLHHARNKYPWFEMQTLYPFDKTDVSTAVADAMAMRTVKSTIVPFPHLLEASRASRLVRAFKPIWK